MLFCNPFIYHLPPSVILSVNEDSFWNLSWSGKSSLSPFNTFLLYRHAFVKNGMHCSKLQSLSHRFQLDSRNWPRSSECPFGICLRPFRSVPVRKKKSIEWTVVTNRMDSVNSVDIPYMDMSEFSILYNCQVYKYCKVELQNVNISKYPWPLDGIIICITLVTLLFL